MKSCLEMTVASSSGLEHPLLSINCNRLIVISFTHPTYLTVYDLNLIDGGYGGKWYGAGPVAHDLN